MRTVITAQDVPASGEVKIAAGTIVTPSAREVARERGVTITEVAPGDVPRGSPPEKTVALGADHGGIQMKQALKTVF